MVKRIDLGLIESREPRTHRRLVTRLGEGLQESGMVEIRGLEPGLMANQDRSRLWVHLENIAVTALGLLEEYFGVSAGDLTALVDSDTSVLWSRSIDGLDEWPRGGCLVELSAWHGNQERRERAEVHGLWLLEAGILLQRLSNGVLGPPLRSPSSRPREPLIRFLARPDPRGIIDVLPGFVWPRRPARYRPTEAQKIWAEDQ